jgi:integrase
MGKRWRKYRVGKYRLGQLHDQAVVVWKDEEGQKHRRRLGVAQSEVAAKALLDAWVRRANLITASDSTTIGTVWIAYEADRIQDGKQASNFKESWKALAPRFEHLPIEAVTADVCRDYTRQRIADGVSQGTVWTELTKLRSCLNWAMKRRVIPIAPYVWLPTKPEGKKRVLTPDEACRLIDACVMPHVKLFVILSLTTGARKGAILALTWDRVDLVGMVIDLREPELIDPLTKRSRKGRGIVPITSVALAALSEAKASALSKHVIEWDGESIKNVRTGYMAAASRAGIDGITPHTLRHTAASWATNSGASMEFASRLLGHRDPQTTRQIYAHTDVESLRPVADIIDLKIRRKG